MEGKLLKSGVLSASLSKSQAASAKSATVLYDYKTHNFVAHNNVEGNSQTKERPVVIAHIATVPASDGRTLGGHTGAASGNAGGSRGGSSQGVRRWRRRKPRREPAQSAASSGRSRAKWRKTTLNAEIKISRQCGCCCWQLREQCG